MAQQHSFRENRRCGDSSIVYRRNILRRRGQFPSSTRRRHPSFSRRYCRPFTPLSIPLSDTGTTLYVPWIALGTRQVLTRNSNHTKISYCNDHQEETPEYPHHRCYNRLAVPLLSSAGLPMPEPIPATIIPGLCRREIPVLSSVNAVVSADPAVSRKRTRSEDSLRRLHGQK